LTKLLKENNIQEISAAQGRVLFPLWIKDNVSFQDLKKRTLLSKATLSYMLDQLEEAGQIKRIRSNDDKRTIFIRLTKMDEDLKRKFFQVSNQMKKIFYKDLTEQEIDDFEEYLNRVLENLIYHRDKNN
jgi:DNA-binding MarR family transcriptional regulator